MKIDDSWPDSTCTCTRPITIGFTLAAVCSTSIHQPVGARPVSLNCPAASVENVAALGGA